MGQTTLGLLRPFAHGRGYRRQVVPTVPAAGLTFKHTVPGDSWERLTALTFTLTTSSAAANRVVTIDYGRANIGTWLQDGPSVVQTASGTQVYNGSDQRGNSEWNTGTAVFFPLWGGFLEAGESFTINVAAIDTADTITGIIYTVEKFEIGPEGYLVGGVTTEQADEIFNVMPS